MSEALKPLLGAPSHSSPRLRGGGAPRLASTSAIEKARTARSNSCRSASWRANCGVVKTPTNWRRSSAQSRSPTRRSRRSRAHDAPRARPSERWPGRSKGRCGAAARRRSAFPVIVAAGPNGAFAHHEPATQPLGEGLPVTIDMGARVARVRRRPHPHRHPRRADRAGARRSTGRSCAPWMPPRRGMRAGMTGKEPTPSPAT